ncbi:hypothetical protein ZEAMMB73_Zm00001d012799 [Zea mays]|uniref:Uncharacterized protein n=1 Tax=Zea mays TaxID=4577 RepID=A0A1D6GCL1_MAIZE|nr:hypothetical protein ZEAMMB73_Zm00001d012799 [Zea mays]
MAATTTGLHQHHKQHKSEAPPPACPRSEGSSYHHRRPVAVDELIKAPCIMHACLSYLPFLCFYNACMQILINHHQSACTNEPYVLL